MTTSTASQSTTAHLSDAAGRAFQAVCGQAELSRVEADRLIEIAGEVAAGHGKPSATVAADLAAQLLGSYPSKEYTNPEVFVIGLAATLAQRHIAVGRIVCDPLVGLPATLKWGPTIADVRAALEAAESRLVSAGAAARVFLDGRKAPPLRPAAPTLANPNDDPEYRIRMAAEMRALSDKIAKSKTMHRGQPKEPTE